MGLTATMIDVTCMVCGKAIQRAYTQVRLNQGRHVCSRQCLSARMRGEGSPVYTERVETKCDTCGTTFQQPQHQYKRTEKHYCSMECLGAANGERIRGPNNARWKGGGPNYYGDNWHLQRRKALKRDGYRCQRCGKDKGVAPLVVHHIRPFKTFGYVKGQNANYIEANDIENLMSLCMSCHLLVEPRGATSG
jgi:5-methylcytosine-specific restriction endonuclease McrA